MSGYITDKLRQIQSEIRLRKMRRGLEAVSMPETEYKRAMHKKKVIKMMLVGMIPVATAVGMFKLMNNGKIDDKKLTAKFTEWKENWKKNQDNKPVNNSEELIEIEGYEHLRALLKQAKKKGYDLDDVDIDPECHIEINKRNCGRYYKIGGEYTINGETYCPMKPEGDYVERGIISYYGEGDSFDGKLTANGAVFDKSAITAAHKTLPIPSLVIVTNVTNGKMALVLVNDRGPYSGNRKLDMSAAGAKVLGYTGRGTTEAVVSYLSGPSKLLQEYMEGTCSPEKMQAEVNKLEKQIAEANKVNEIMLAMAKELQGHTASLREVVNIYNTSVACYDMMNEKKDLDAVVGLAMRLTSDTAYYEDYLKHPEAFNFPKSDGRA